MFSRDVRIAKVCDVLCAETGLFGMWRATGPTAKAVRLLRDNGGPLSGNQKVMFLCAWALWNGAGRISVWAMVHRLPAHHLFTLGEVLQAMAGGSYSLEAWVSKRACFAPAPVARRARKRRR